MGSHAAVGCGCCLRLPLPLVSIELHPALHKVLTGDSLSVRSNRHNIDPSLYEHLLISAAWRSIIAYCLIDSIE